MLLKLFLCLLSCLIVLSDDARDECVQNILEETAGKSDQFRNIAQMMYPSRNLYGHLFGTNISGEELDKYCETHNTVRFKLDHCPDSPYRRMVSNGFGLADHICIKKRKDFVLAMDCMGEHFAEATLNCLPSCSLNENRSLGYMHTVHNHIITNIFPFYMAGDCSYLKCMADCRRPLLKTKCGDNAGSLDMDSLYATYGTSWDIYEPPEIRPLLPRGFRSVYPYECRTLAESAACDTGYDSTTATSALTQGPTQETRILIAVWSTDSVVETLPSTCNLETRARSILCHFNATGFHESVTC